MTELLVSVIIPVHCGERFLGAALDSVAAQTYPEIEIIVVDDGSTDGSADIAAAHAHPRIRLLRTAHQGVAEARNAGLRAAAGELIAFLDQDDEWAPEKLAKQVALLSARADVSIVRTYVLSVLEPGTPRPPWLPAEWLRTPGPRYLPSTWLIRREAFDRVGEFDPAHVTSNDSDWLLRAIELGLTAEIIPEDLVHWRVHGANATHQRDVMRASAATLLHARIKRGRAADRAG